MCTTNFYIFAEKNSFSWNTDIALVDVNIKFRDPLRELLRLKGMRNTVIVVRQGKIVEVGLKYMHSMW